MQNYAENRQHYELGASEIQDFIKERCIIEPENGDLITPILDLQNSVWQYCKSKGLEYVEISQLGEKLKAVGVKHERRRKKGKLPYVYVGIALGRSSHRGNSTTYVEVFHNNIRKEGAHLR